MNLLTLIATFTTSGITTSGTTISGWGTSGTISDSGRRIQAFFDQLSWTSKNSYSKKFWLTTKKI